MPDPQAHRLDISEVTNPNMITEEAQAILEEMIREQSLQSDALTFFNLSAQINNQKGLETTFILTNGTVDDMVIKKLPLNFYDATGELVAQGTFLLSNFSVQANTSKPLTLVFPKEGILKDKMDLSSTSIELAQE